MMRKSIILLAVTIISLMTFNCGQNNGYSEKTRVDDVEVIINPVEPSPIPGEFITLSLKAILTIDSEWNNIASLGLRNIGGFDINSEGNLYLFKFMQSEGDHIFKFDIKGNFIASFGPKGQGPGEFQYLRYLEVNKRDEVVVTDYLNFSISFMDNDGTFKKKISLGFPSLKVSHLENGNFLSFRRLMYDVSNEYVPHFIDIFNSQFEKIKELDSYNPHSALS